MINRYRFASLISALLIYAIFSAPTPSHIGPAEGAIAALLLMSCLPQCLIILRYIGAPHPHGKLPYYTLLPWAVLACLYGITIPTITGILNGSSNSAIARDIIAYLYLFLPLFTADLFINNKRRTYILIATIAIMALSFALRGLIEGSADPLIALLQNIIPLTATQNSYFANAPTLLFTAGIGYAAGLMILTHKKAAPKYIMMALASFMLCAVIIAATTVSLQRATIGAFICIIIAAHITCWHHRPARTLFFTAIILICAITAYNTAPIFDDLSHALDIKTRLHGLNNRSEEWSAVLAIWTQDTSSILWGQGWGGSFHSPATDGQYVNFTHSIISSFLLKTGLLGLFIMGLYGFKLGLLWIKNTRTMPLTSISLAAPILIDITLYGAYKSLDFGVILLALCAIAFSAEKLLEDKEKTDVLFPC